MKNKFYTTFASALITTPALASVVLSCDSNKEIVKKDNKLWGDLNFATSYEQLSYQEDADNVELIQELDTSINGPNTMYQMLVYSFADGDNDGIGDLIGAKEKIPYLKTLGIDQIWLSPIHPASSYHGYDIIDYTKVAPEFGGMNAFDDFLKVAHQNGIKIYLDMVFNHTSFEHPWFQAALTDTSSKYRNYYRFGSGYGDTNTMDSTTSNNFVNNPGKTTNIPYVSKFWKGMPDLNLDNPEVIEEIKNVQRFWTKKGVDGFRYDAFYEFFSSKGETQNNYNVQKILYELRKSSEDGAVEAGRRNNFNVFMVGEWWGGALDAKQYLSYNGQKALDSCYELKHTPNLRVSHFDMTNITAQYKNLGGQWTPTLNHHDVNRWLVKYNQEILNKLPNESSQPISQKQVNALSTALFTLLARPANPIIYFGDELAYHGAKNPNDAALREPIKWSNQKYNIDFYEKRSGQSEKITINQSNDRPDADKQTTLTDNSFFVIKEMNKIRKENPFFGLTDEETILEYDSSNVIDGAPGDMFIRKSLNGETKFLVVATMEANLKLRVNFENANIVLQSKTGVKFQNNVLELPANSYTLLRI